MKNKDIKPYNENGKQHGYWEEYYYNGELCYKGFMTKVIRLITILMN